MGNGYNEDPRCLDQATAFSTHMILLSRFSRGVDRRPLMTLPSLVPAMRYLQDAP